MTDCTDFIDLMGDCKNLFFRIGKKINADLKKTYSLNESQMMLCLKKLGRSKLSDLTDLFGAKPLVCMRLGILERKNFVAREVDMADKRNVYHYVTPKGEKYVEKVVDSIKESLGQIFGPLDPKDMDILVKSLKNINAVFSKVV